MPIHRFLLRAKLAAGERLLVAGDPHDRGELRARKETMDWYPEDRHGTIPDIARFGKKGVRQCTLCHLPDGSGRPENAPISAYHPTYFMQQMQDFRDGLRKSADPRKANTNTMIGFAKATTREEDMAAAQYLRAAAVSASHQGGRVEDGAEGAAAGRDAHGCSGRRRRRHGADQGRRDRRGPGRQPARRSARHAHALDGVRAAGHAEPRQTDRGQGSVRARAMAPTSKASARCRRSRAARRATRCGSSSISRRARAADRGAR